MKRLRVDQANRRATGAIPQVRSRRVVSTQQNEVTLTRETSEGGKTLRHFSGSTPAQKSLPKTISTTS